MSFNKTYLPEMELLRKKLEMEGLEKFVKSYDKSDAILGSIESMEFLEEKRKEYREQIRK